MLGLGNHVNRSSAPVPSDMPSLPQCLALDPIILGNQKHIRTGELRKALGFPLGVSSEDHSFGAAHSKPPSPVATEDLKHFKEGVQDTSRKARDRATMLRQSLFKLDKYREALSSKKRQRSELSSSERPGLVNFDTVRTQTHRNVEDPMTRRMEDRAKSERLKKRVRTSVADIQAENRLGNNSRQDMFTGKDSGTIQSVGIGSVRSEEKTQKIKKKRSVGAVGNRVISSEREIVRTITTPTKLNADPRLRTCDAQSFRLKSSPRIGGISRLDSSAEPTNSDACTILKNELESAPPLKDRTFLLEQKVFEKGHHKANVQEDNHLSTANAVTKAKISRAPRTGSIMNLDSSNIHSPSGAYQGSEPPTLINSQKQPLSTGSSIHPMTQWIGQRPKNSRTRRTNLVGPMSNHGDTENPSQGTAYSDLSARKFLTSGSFKAGSVDNGTPKYKKEVENAFSPFGMSESEESGAGDRKVREKDTEAANEAGSFVATRKNKMMSNEIGDGVRRQEKSGMGLSLGRLDISTMREKSESLPTTKPLNGIRPSYDKNKSKSGRPPSKKLKDRKSLSRSGPNCGSTDFTGELYDDQEALLVAANSTRRARSLASSSPFWKKMEFIFASVNSEDTAYLNQQINLAKELDQALSQMLDLEGNVLCVTNKEEFNCPRKEPSKSNKVTSLYQRVLSALIEEHECDEYNHQTEGKNMSLQYGSDDSHCGSCNQIDFEPRDWDRMDSEAESRVGFQSPKSCMVDRFSCDRSTVSNSYRNQNMSSSVHSFEQWQGEDEFSHSYAGQIGDIYSNDFAQQPPRELHASSGFTPDCPYHMMGLDDRLILELQSIGLYPDTLPALAGEDPVNQEIMELKKGISQQIGRKKRHLGKVDKSIQKGREVEKWQVERVAMDQLVEMAYRKRLACRGNDASKSAVRKASRQAALEFIKWTLVRCQKFEDSRISCFNDPAMLDIILSSPPSNNATKSLDCVGSGTASNTLNEASYQRDTQGSGAISSSSERLRASIANTSGHGSVVNRTKKREERIDEIVASASSRVTSNLPLGGGIKGKRKQEESRSDSFSAEKPEELKHNDKKRQENLSVEEEGPMVDLGDELEALDPMEGLGGTEDHQDLSSWLNFEGVQDHDSVGLEIPMDDLSELNMLI